MFFGELALILHRKRSIKVFQALRLRRELQVGIVTKRSVYTSVTEEVPISGPWMITYPKSLVR
jgi:hypothetical protein